MSFSVIHLSDIHIKNENDNIIRRIDALKSACISSLPSNGDVVIVISGDIAYSGEKKQYEIAKGLVDTIVDYIKSQKGSNVYVVCVPGNHDCDFSEKSTVRDALVNCINPSNIDMEYYNSIISVQKNYSDFAKSYGIDTSFVLPRKEVMSDGSSLLFILANTSWMSELKERPGKIIMPSNLFEETLSKNYKIVFYVFHHPTNWLNPDYKKEYINHIRTNADIVLVGHEHARDEYSKKGDMFSLFFSHGKELQDSESEESAFTVINFDRSFSNYEVVDYKWSGGKYNRLSDPKIHPYSKNIATKNRVFLPNEETIKDANDIGVVLNHFAKDHITLSDLFIWPDLSKSDYLDEKKGNKIIRTNAVEELYKNTLNILVGDSCSGKTAIAKKLFLLEEEKKSSCILLSGTDFTSIEESQIQKAIEEGYIRQYSKDYLEDFRQLPKEQRSIIIDDFDRIKNVKGRRNVVLDYLCGYFGRVTIILSTSLEITTIMTSKSISALDYVVYYVILPLGNRKRKELVSKWYYLSEKSLLDEEINDRIDRAIEAINVFLGSGNAVIPAAPVFMLSVLQNLDALNKTFSGSKYGFLYESLIIKSLSTISDKYSSAGSYDIDMGILSELSFEMLLEKRKSFTKEQLEKVITKIKQKNLLQISNSEFIQRMLAARMITLDSSSSDEYRFLYPYIFYYFCGKYIAYHFDEIDVKNEVEYMSARLYNEEYGNIIIFVCHFANNSDIIDTVLLEAYDTLNRFTEFDFTKSNPIFEEIKTVVDALIPKSIASSEEEVSSNRDKHLDKMDEIGVGSGQVANNQNEIDDEVSEKEKDMADVVAAFKTMEVLGEILQNYPMGIDAQKKTEIVDEIHRLGMRSVQAIINTMGYMEQDLVEYIYQRAKREGKSVERADIAKSTKRFINLLISGMARGMIHQVAVSLNSEHLLPAAKAVFDADTSISSKLVLLDLNLNCLNKCSVSDIKNLKKEFDGKNEQFASRIVDSIVGHYLNYHQSNPAKKAQLCSLCHLSQKQALIANQRNLLN